MIWVCIRIETIEDETISTLTLPRELNEIKGDLHQHCKGIRWTNQRYSWNMHQKPIIE